MRPLILFAIIGFLANPTTPGQLGPEAGNFTIAVDVDLAIFNLTVTDSNGRHAPGLKQSDFRVYEEGRLQDITLFHAEDAPASIGLIIDNSGSMARKRAEVTEAAIAFLGASNPEDEMFVVNFNERVYMGLPDSIPFTNDTNQIRRALLQPVPAGMTALYDALAVAIEHLKGGTRDRKALVVLSDGGDNASRHGLEDVMQAAQRSNATIYAIGIYDEYDEDRNPSALRKIAQLSGGRAYFPKSLNELNQVWRDVAGGLRTQYTIGYLGRNPNRDGKLRKVKIVASHGGRTLRVNTREGYFAPADRSISR